ncbi:DUF3969 domain-containing protein [Staphylococcus muscae]|uniref:DUF3969 family protein n=1 Tax=Staphylococcus muscae TaxID=1294 RepID=A0A240C6W1_9STAP|nr:DUF3969 family protein [Staphylococcus muscae]AVQ33333.1 DUF3969 domain-containing protein [Staphylococcus muscae]PNY98064.1 DUF3969 domain-containing protein [Staphylococcus muscae]GGA94482.1 hypothetical protein GCM10007183_18350 [Staphylococcus muscae]SNW03033.1 Uncharacterised protein [Staphylococcus muscae]
MILFENTREVEKFALIIIHGLFSQMNKGLISIENAEHIFFTPHTITELEKLNVDQSIIELIHLGTELEDLEDFAISVKEETDKFLAQTEQLLTNYQDVEFTEKILTDLKIIKKNTDV